MGLTVLGLTWVSLSQGVVRALFLSADSRENLLWLATVFGLWPLPPLKQAMVGGVFLTWRSGSPPASLSYF